MFIKQKSSEKTFSKKSLKITVAVHVVILGFVLYPLLQFRNNDAEQLTVNQTETVMQMDFTHNTPIKNDGQSAARLQKMAGEKMAVPAAPAEYNQQEQTALTQPNATTMAPVNKPVVTANNTETPSIASHIINTIQTKPLPPIDLPGVIGTKMQEKPHSDFNGVAGGKDTKPAPNGNINSGNGGSDAANKPGSTGNGKSTGEGLKGRHPIYRPDSHEMNMKEGTVKVQIAVNRNGIVTIAKFDAKGSNTADADLVTKSLAYANQYKYEADPNAPEPQIGYITFVYKLRK